MAEGASSGLSVEQLPPPPRRLSWLARARVRLDGGVQVMGWVVLIGVTLFAAIFVGASDLQSLTLDEATAIRRPAQILTTDETGFEVNEEPIYAIRFRYQRQDGAWATATSYAAEPIPEAGTQHTALTFEGRPELTVLEGARRAPFGPYTLLILLGLPIGLVMVLGRQRTTARWLRLLERGKLSRAALKSKTPTGMEVNEEPVLKLTFQYFDDRGDAHTFVIKTHRVDEIEDEGTEAILYDAEHPEVAVPLDLIRGVRIEGDGRIACTSTLGALAHLLGPVLTIGAFAAALLYVMS